MQGSSVATDRKPQIVIDVQAGDRLLQVELIRHGEVIRIWHPQGSTFAGHLMDEQDPARPDTWYYVRVTGKNGEQAWSSPVWVSFLPEAPFAQDLLYWIPQPRIQWAVEPAEGGFRSRVWHTGCERDGAITISTIAGADSGSTAGLPVVVQPGQSAELSTSGPVTGPFRLVMTEGAETWTFLRHRPTV